MERGEAVLRAPASEDWNRVLRCGIGFQPLPQRPDVGRRVARRRRLGKEATIVADKGPQQVDEIPGSGVVAFEKNGSQCA